MASNNTVRLAICALLLLAALPLHASVAKAVSFDEKVQAADSIILGRCTATRSEWDPSGRWILTYSTFQVEKALKGALLPEITVVTPGGQVGSVRQETVGIPHFSKGDQNILFVKGGAAGPTVAYLDQGAYRVEKDSRGEMKVAPVASSLVLVDAQTGEAAGHESARSLQDFERDVKVAVDRDRERLQRYGVTPAEKRPEKSAASQLLDFVKEHRLLLSLLALAIVISSYLLIKNR